VKATDAICFIRNRKADRRYMYIQSPSPHNVTASPHTVPLDCANVMPSSSRSDEKDALLCAPLAVAKERGAGTLAAPIAEAAKSQAG